MFAAVTSDTRFADGVAVLPPDADNRSNSPSAFPSLCGVGPIAVFNGRGDADVCRCVLGLKSLRNVEGES